MADSLYTRMTEAPTSNYDVSLRPPVFSEFCGQEKVKERLLLMVQAAKMRGDVLDHVLLSGPPGLGKTTLANIKIAGLNKFLRIYYARVMALYC